MGKKMIIYISYKSMKIVLGFLILLFYIIASYRLTIPTFSVGGISPQLLHITAIGLALGTDAFSLSIGIGMRRVCAYDVLKTSIVIGVFHVIMPFMGLILGELLGTVLGNYAKYLGSFLIVLIGGNMILESLKGELDHDCNRRLAGWGLIALAIGVSIDALTVGLGLGTFNFPIPLAVGIIGLLGGMLTAAGLLFGRFLGEWFGEKSELVGGTVLILLGLNMLLF